MTQILNIMYKKKLFFIIIPSILLISLPVLLLTGPFLPDLAVSLCAILFIINLFCNSLNKFSHYYKSKFFFIFLFFYIILILSSLLSDSVLFSLETSIFYIRFGVFSLAVWFLLDHNKLIIKYLFYSFIISFTILLADAYLQFFTGSNIFGWKIIGTRVSSFFKEELILGSYLSRLYPIFFAIYIYKFKKINLFFIFIFILTEILIFLSGERASFFYLNLSTIIIIALSKNLKLVRLGILFISLLILILISFFNTGYKKRMIDNTVNQIFLNNQDISEKINFKIFSTEHQNHYKSALKMFWDNKLIGIGPKLFRKNCDKEKYKISFESCSTHPHNTYIQLLAETGILGFSVIFFAFVISLYFCIKHFYLKVFYKKFIFTDFQISLISSIIVSLWPIIPTANFFNNWVNVIYYLPVGILLWSLKKNFNK